MHTISGLTYQDGLGSSVVIEALGAFPVLDFG